MSDNENQRKGGIERANRLTDEERTEIARAAAQARWGDRIRQATHGGQLIIGDSVLECAVLEDGTRVLSQATVLGALNRASTRGAHRSARTAVEGGHLPPFLSAAVLRPFLTGSLIADLISPIPYRMPRADGSYGTGQVGVAHGYPAEILPNICEVYLKYRDDCLSTGRRPQPGQESAIRAADLLIRGLAAVGIIALVDEATGYQAVRDRHELERDPGRVHLGRGAQVGEDLPRCVLRGDAPAARLGAIRPRAAPAGCGQADPRPRLRSAPCRSAGQAGGSGAAEQERQPGAAAAPAPQR